MKQRNRMKIGMDYTFYGVDGFECFQPIIEKILSSISQASLVKFTWAVNEAICNALRYGKDGIDESKVNFTVRYNGRFLIAKVISNSGGFDVSGYLRDLSSQKGLWWECLKNKNRGRGLWIMLNGTKRVIFNDTGDTVYLVFNTQEQNFLANEENEYLLSKIKVLKNNEKKAG